MTEDEEEVVWEYSQPLVPTTHDRGRMGAHDAPVEHANAEVEEVVDGHGAQEARQRQHELLEPDPALCEAKHDAAAR